MKTTLPLCINTVPEAQKFLTELYNKESFHPEDDAFQIEWHTCETPTFAECEQLNQLMSDIYAFPGNEDAQNMVFDPCEFLLMLDPDYREINETDKLEDDPHDARNY